MTTVWALLLLIQVDRQTGVTMQSVGQFTSLIACEKAAKGWQDQGVKSGCVERTQLK
jgi:hypothetical protein